MSKDVLKGVFVEFGYRSQNRPYYTEEELRIQLEELIHQIIMEGRINKITKLNDKIKGNNKNRLGTQ